jgi:DNA polymerase-3 subunit beta
MVVNTKRFKAALTEVMRIIPNKPTLEILGNVKVTMESGFLTLESTNLDVTIVKHIETTHIENTYTFLVKASLLKKVVSKLKTANFELKYLKDINSKLVLSAGKLKVNLPTEGIEDYPYKPEVDNLFEFNLPGAMFKKAIERSLFAVADDESRGALMHVLMESKDGKLNIVGTDGHRLGEATIKSWSFPEFKVLVNRDVLTMFVKLGADTDTLVNIDDKLIRFKSRETELYGKLVNKTYPDYLSCFPKTFDKRVYLKTKELIQVVDNLLPFANAKTSLGILNFEGDKHYSHTEYSEKLKIEVINRSDNLNAEEDLDIILRGDSLRTGINLKYLLQILKFIPTSEIEVNFNNEVGAFLITPNYLFEEHDISERYILMPLRIHED